MIVEKRQIKEINLSQQIEEMEKKLSSFPEGNLICCHQGKRVKWYVSSDGEKRYIPKKDIFLAHNLAEKKYTLCKINDAKTELKALQSIPLSIPNSAAKLLDVPGYKELLPEYAQFSDSYLNEWQNAPFAHLESRPEGLIHKTLRGEKVRSKSEGTIANCLYLNHIPYRYEQELICDGVILHPDFVTLHPQERRIIYWEHLGLMDLPSYRDTAAKKLRLYSDSGIYPMIDLILTSETKEKPLDIGIVEGLIQTYFF